MHTLIMWLLYKPFVQWTQGQYIDKWKVPWNSCLFNEEETDAGENYTRKSFISYTFIRYHNDDEIKKDKMVGACNTQWKFKQKCSLKTWREVNTWET
jgi:hypothetical protein